MWPNAHAGADLQAFLTFCFKPNLLLAHKLTLLIYGDNNLSISSFFLHTVAILCQSSLPYTHARTMSLI